MALRFSLFFLVILLSINSWSVEVSEKKLKTINWKSFENKMKYSLVKKRREGISYVISGSIAVLAASLVEGSTSDPLEKGVYSLFQTLGISSIGYGGYLWQVGNTDRVIYQTLNSTKALSSSERSKFLKNYYIVRKKRKRRNQIVRAITHGMIAGFNIYSSTRQKDENFKNMLLFMGGVNLLASVSFTFDF